MNYINLCFRTDISLIAGFILSTCSILISDLLVDVIRQLTDIHDKDREIVKKLEIPSYRKFAFRQVRSLAYDFAYSHC